VLLALLLAVRLLSPAGFMPSFDRGTITIVACPDAASAPVMMGHHHHSPGSKKPHQPCPYASASLLSAVGDYLPLLATLFTIGLTPLLGPRFLFIEASRLWLRPPLRGPPLPA